MRQHSLRLPDELMEAVDSARGMIPRNPWIEHAVREALLAQARIEPHPKEVQMATPPRYREQEAREAEARRQRSPKPAGKIEEPREPRPETELPKIAKRHWA